MAFLHLPFVHPVAQLLHSSSVGGPQVTSILPPLGRVGWLWWDSIWVQLPMTGDNESDFCGLIYHFFLWFEFRISIHSQKSYHLIIHIYKTLPKKNCWLTWLYLILLKLLGIFSVSSPAKMEDFQGTSRRLPRSPLGRSPSRRQRRRPYLGPASRHWKLIIYIYNLCLYIYTHV